MCSCKPAATIVRAIFEDGTTKCVRRRVVSVSVCSRLTPLARLGEIYMHSLKEVGDLVTQVNIAEVCSFYVQRAACVALKLGHPQTMYRVNKDPLFTNLGPDREAPAIGKARVL